MAIIITTTIVIGNDQPAINTSKDPQIDKEAKVFFNVVHARPTTIIEGSTLIGERAVLTGVQTLAKANLAVVTVRLGRH
jgi:hypothetical protein